MGDSAPLDDIFEECCASVGVPRWTVKFVGGVNSARGQDSSFGGGAVVNCFGAVHMEEEVQDRVQVEVGREEQGEGKTHGKEQGEEQRSKEQTLNRSSWMTMRMT